MREDTRPKRSSQIYSRHGIAFTNDITADLDITNPDRLKGLYTQICNSSYSPRPESIVDSYSRKVIGLLVPEVYRYCIAVYLLLLPNKKAA